MSLSFWHHIDKNSDLDPGRMVKAILTSEFIPDWVMDTLALREKVISTKDFSAHYFNTLSSFFSQQILLQA